MLLLLLFQTHANVSVHTTQRTNWQTPVPSHLGVKLPATPAPQEPSSTHSCETRKLEKLTLDSGTTGGARNMTQNASKTLHRHHGELVKIMSRFKVRTALRKTATRSINCARMERERLGSEVTARRTYVKFVQSLQ